MNAPEEKLECGHCGSDDTEYDTVTDQHWCNKCWRWFKEERDSDEESRESIERYETAQIEEQERRYDSF